MSFGFDAIDRKFARKGSIKLECTVCGKTDDVRCRTDIDDAPALCNACYQRKALEIFGG